MAVALLYLSWTFLAAVTCFVICLFEWVHRPGNEKYRSVVFGSFGFSMAVPISHLIINEAWFDNYGDPYKFSSAGVYYALLVSCYIIGLYIFTVRYCLPYSGAPSATTQADTISVVTAIRSGT
jgi:hypothetical protein